MPGKPISERKRGLPMPLTRSFRETVKEQMDRSPAFRRELLREAVSTMLSGDLDAGKSVLRDFINGSIRFPALAESMQRSPKSLMRMFSPSGNPQAKNLFEVVAILQQAEGLRLEVRATRTAA